ncbi:NCS2 family permease [Candidatus Micrarchaeota archaeon]|nr:NCS2 family permease [Candidatus Micrarchaeota archaeon]
MSEECAMFGFGKPDVKHEFIAALTVFFASSYMLFLNPQIMGEAGVEFEVAFVATVLSAIVGTLILAFIANKPYIIAPGITLTTFMSYSVVKAHGISWEIALAASLLVGIFLFAISISKIRVWFVEAIPMGLKYGIVAGIGLMLVFIGLVNAGLLVKGSGDVFIKLGDMRTPSVIIALFGLVVTWLLYARGVKAAFVLGILITTALSIAVSHTALSFDTQVDLGAALSKSAFSFDLDGLENVGALSIVIALFLVAFFDTIGSSTALLIRGNYVDKKKNIVGLDRIMITDSLATIFGAIVGAPASTVYTESASAYESGGRTGLTAVFICVLLLLSLFLLPFIRVVPLEATASVLIIVGLLMLESITRLNLKDKEEASASIFCVAAIGLTQSITYGIGITVILYVVLKLLLGKWKEVHPGMWITALLFTLNFLGVF